MNKKNIMVADLLMESSSSSSSSESDEEYIVLTLESEERHRVKDFEKTVNSFTAEEFRRNFRITRPTFIKLNKMFEESEFYPKARTHGRCDLTPSAVCTLTFLWFAGNKCTIRTLSTRFGIGETTVFRALKNFMAFLVSLAPTIIKFYNNGEVAEAFEHLSGGFLGCIGVIDATFVAIRTPYHKIKSTYVNRHDTPSLTLQAICDHRRLFLDVFTGIPSKIHDARVYKFSFVSKKLQEITDDGRYHIVGDSAYPIKKWLLTPYRNYANITPEERNFNEKLRKCRVKIENAFALLKSRWRQLIKIEFGAVLKMADFIIASCVLHNLCILNGDDWEDEDMNNRNNEQDDEEQNMPQNRQEQREKREGEEKRRVLTELLHNIQ